MNNQTFYKGIVGSVVIIEKDHKVILLKRKKSWSGDEQYTLPGGKIEANESIKDAAIREVKEEIGLNLKKEDLEFLHLINRKKPGLVAVICFFRVTKWEGNPVNKEPQKHTSVEWFDLNNLPENIMPAYTYVLNMYKDNKKIYYDEIGF